ncbi:hypothetical protein SCA03_15110 [Streptomyces cacaoi]|uniref:Uncharacterized protein n=1 Tax=Streptomyces cacaoi TaxID=1898 RepID=A0A4Y3QYE8_STRCI|nr:hypothetical protein SCA03_15110 [Streptomyces cacaoi]
MRWIRTWLFSRGSVWTPLARGPVRRGRSGPAAPMLGAGAPGKALELPSAHADRAQPGPAHSDSGPFEQHRRAVPRAFGKACESTWFARGTVRFPFLNFE